MDLQTIIICVLSSTVAAAVVTSIKEIFIWKLNRKAKLDDDSSAKSDQSAELKKVLDEHSKCLEGVAKAIKDLETKLSLSLENDKIILKDKIKYLTMKYSDIGEITMDEKQAINHMWSIYRYDLGGEDLGDYMDILEKVKVVNHHEVLKGVYL